MNRYKLIGQVNNLIHKNNGKTFIREHKDDILDYKVQDDKLYFYSELFFQWISDDLHTWTSDQLQILVRTLGGKQNENVWKS